MKNLFIFLVIILTFASVGFIIGCAMESRYNEFFSFSINDWSILHSVWVGILTTLGFFVAVNAVGDLLTHNKSQ